MPKSGLGIYMNKIGCRVIHNEAQAETNLLVFAGGSTSDDLDQFAGNGGLTLSVVKNLEPKEAMSKKVRKK